jgi:hypothetical protein
MNTCVFCLKVRQERRSLYDILCATQRLKRMTDASHWLRPKVCTTPFQRVRFSFNSVGIALLDGLPQGYQPRLCIRQEDLN